MSGDFLNYYERELTRLRQDADEFARAHPKVAARLRLGADSGDDPHVERLLEGFAYLTAGVRQTLDDGYADIAEALLAALHPHALAPTPPAAVVQFRLAAAQDALVNGLTVPRHSPIETEPIRGEPCRFRTTHAVELFPLSVAAASVQAAPVAAPALPAARGAAAVIKVRLEARAALSQLGIKRLRFHLNAPLPVAARLYESLLKDAIEVAIAADPADRNAIALGAASVSPGGFAAEESLWSASAAGAGLRAAAHFLAFPRAFLFVDVTLPSGALKRLTRSAELYFYLRTSAPELESAVGAETFRLGCTPVVNLQTKRAEPIRITGETAAVRVVPDARRPAAFEVYSIDRVALVSPEGESSVLPPLESAPASGPFWYATRKSANALAGLGDRGTEVWLTLADRSQNPELPAGSTLHVDVTCSNRDLPSRLPFGGGQPRLTLATGGPVGTIECLSAPTAPGRPDLGPGALWRLVAACNLNPLSVADDGAGDGIAGAAALRHLLETCAPQELTDTAATLAGITSVTSRRVTAWAGGAVCRGAELTVEVDASAYPGGPFLFLTVLDRLLGQLATLNSFTRLVATRAGRDGVYHRWPARCGDRPLI